MLAETNKSLKKKGKVRVEFNDDEQGYADFKTQCDRVGKPKWEGLRLGRLLATRVYKKMADKK